MSDREITREAVIRAFESYLAQRVYINHPHPDVIRAAVEMLKEPEARVLELKEIQKTDLHGSYVWLELLDERDIFHLRVYCDPYVFEDFDTSIHFDIPEEDYKLDWDKYRKTWRCWTAEPEARQRGAEKWDG